MFEKLTFTHSWIIKQGLGEKKPFHYYFSFHNVRNRYVCFQDEPDLGESLKWLVHCVPWAGDTWGHSTGYKKTIDNDPWFRKEWFFFFYLQWSPAWWMRHNGSFLSRTFMFPKLKKKVLRNSFNTSLPFKWSKSGFFIQT